MQNILFRTAYDADGIERFEALSVALDALQRDEPAHYVFDDDQPGTVSLDDAGWADIYEKRKALKRTVRVARVPNAAARQTLNVEGRLDQLLLTDLLPDPKRHAKDGPAFLQGSVKSNGAPRTAQSMSTMEFVGYDIDNGQCAEEIEDAARRHQIECLIVPSYNDGKPETRVSTDKVMVFVNRNKSRWAGLDVEKEAIEEQILAYLEEVKGYLPHVLQSCRFVGRQGHEYVVQHLPLSRFRVKVPLQQSVMLEDLAPTLAGAKARWIKFYYALGKKLGIEHFDESCKDLSRLFFAHRRPENVKSWYVHALGLPVDFHAELAAANGAVETCQQSIEKRVGSSGRSVGRADYQTDWMPHFAAANMARFNAGTYIADHGTNGTLKTDGRAEAECEFADEHQSGDAPGARTMYALDSRIANNGVGIVGCNHQHCSYKSPQYIEAVALRCGHGVDDLLSYVEKATAASSAARPAVFAGDSFDEACQITVAQFEAASGQDEEPYFYKSGGKLARLKHGGHEVSAEPLRLEDVRYEANRLIDWRRRLKGGGDKSVAAYEQVVKFVHASPSLRVPSITGIVSVPTYTKEGRLITQRGFDRATGIYLQPAPSLDILSVPANPSVADVRAACAMLMTELHRDFPFSDRYDGSDKLPVYLGDVDNDGFRIPNLKRGESARANALAMILHPHVRDIIDDCSPIYMIDAAGPASGKGYLTNTVTAISEGRESTKRAPLSNPDEMRKQITATLLSQQQMFLQDNINHHLDDPVWANAVTSGYWRDRQLGVSGEVAGPLRLQFIVTMNQGTMSLELLRRACPIRLDADVPNPDLDRPQESFKHRPLMQWSLQNRSQLLNACHVLIANWFARGQPAGKAVLPSFERWSEVMGGILEAAEIPGFLDNVPYLRQQRDEGSGDERAFVQQWWTMFGEKEILAHEVYFTGTDGFGAQSEDFAYPGLIDPEEFRDRSPIRRLGRRLAKMVGRTYYVVDRQGSKVTVKVAASTRQDAGGVLRYLRKM